MCIVSTCVLHNWCIIENDVEEEDFEEVVSSLDCNVNRFSAEAELGRRRAIGGGNNKCEMLCQYINAKVWIDLPFFLLWEAHTLGLGFGSPAISRSNSKMLSIKL